MSLKDKLSTILEKPLRVGQYAVQTDHPGLIKSIDKKKTSKVDRSIFTNDEDAEEEYITGIVKSDGRINKTKIESILTKRLESLDDR